MDHTLNTLPNAAREAHMLLPNSFTPSHTIQRPQNMHCIRLVYCSGERQAQARAAFSLEAPRPGAASACGNTCHTAAQTGHPYLRTVPAIAQGTRAKNHTGADKRRPPRMHTTTSSRSSVRSRSGACCTDESDGTDGTRTRDSTARPGPPPMCA